MFLCCVPWNWDWLSLIYTSPEMDMSQSYEYTFFTEDKSVYKIARRTTVVLWRRESLYIVFDLLVNCLGGPLIDTWGGDWILSPGVWHVTAHTIPANHLIYSGYKTPLPGATEYSIFTPAQSSCTHPSVLHFFSTFDPFSIFEKQWIQQLYLYHPSGLICEVHWMTGDWQHWVLTSWVRQLHVTLADN